MSADIGLPREPSIPSSGPDSFWSDLVRATDRERPSRGRHAARFTSVNADTELLTAVGAVGYQDAHAPMAPVRRFPTVSVVIPWRDNEKTIRATVESVLRQDYRALRQIILVGSPIDATWKGLAGIYDRRLLELFYRFIQPSRDALGAAICVGTSALYRRTVLDAIGGFPKIGQSEDIYTGLWMHDAGYSTRYVPVVVSKGVTPNNLDNFVAQQYRWCEGSMTMLATKRFHTTPNLSLKARLCYWSGFLYYVGTALSSLIIPLPAIIMTWFFPEWSWNTIWLAGTLALWLAVYPLVMHGRWRIEVLPYPNRLWLRPRLQRRPSPPGPGRRMAPDRF